MKKTKIDVSIIIVNYKVEKEVIDCVTSIEDSNSKASFEIIVVDNDWKSSLKGKLDKFTYVKYIESKENIGFGAGNNLGAKYAKGNLLFFLNPDTVIEKNTIDTLFSFVKSNAEVGMAAPLLFDLSGKVYPCQGSDAFTLIKAVVVLSFINKIFPNNPISAKFFHKNWNKKDIEEFDVVPGTAFMIKKDIFEKVGTFDQGFFLYFEEYDLAKRIKKLGLKNYIIPGARVFHIWEASTKKIKDINKIFSQSRFLFFKKNYNLFTALIVNFVANIGKYELILFAVVIFSLFLGFFKARELMPFIGDQGWFYLSARNMLLNAQVPLVGIASSHPWLHQGPLWTYILALFLWLFNFDPVAGVYPAIILGVLSVIGICLLGTSLFSRRVGLIASILYATSPLTVFYMRFPYHTSPIPFFVIIFIFFLFKITKNNLSYLPFSLLTLGILYNFEIATVVLWPILIGIVGYKLLKDKSFVRKATKKNLIISGIMFLIPLTPIILYDIRNGFPQTLKFSAWIFYKLFSFGNSFSTENLINMINFLFINFSKLVFAANGVISFSLLVIFVLWMAYSLIRKRDDAYKLLFALFIFLLLVLIFNQIPSDAYLPVLFPATVLLLALFFESIIKRMRIAFILLILVTFANVYSIFKEDFILDKDSSRLFTLDKRIEASKEIISLSSGKDYNLRGLGLGSEHESFTMNYEYLTWWLGDEPSKEIESVKIYISESEKGIKITAND